MFWHRRFSNLVMALALAGSSAPVHATEAPEPPSAGFRADYLRELARLRGRALALAGEIPAESYGQATGGHSLAECLSDLAAGSRRILLGMEREVPGAGGRRQAPVDKERVIRDLTAARDGVRRAVEVTPDESLGAPIDFLGRRWTVRALFLLLLGQTHEGLGHAAADAESLGIVPPWLRQKRVAEASED